MLRDGLSAAVEDYLKVIYTFSSSGQRASTRSIAEKLGVSPASVTGMVQHLAVSHPDLVDYQKHQGVRLTEAGERVALELIRHHRLIELYLQERLGYRWDEVHPEADRLEHVISEEFEEKLARELGEPQRDPHGEPIPSREFDLPQDNSIPLSQLRSGQHATVARIQSDQPDLLRHLESLGLVPQVVVSVLDYSAWDGNLTMLLSGRSDSVVLGEAITRQIFVELSPEAL